MLLQKHKSHLQYTQSLQDYKMCLALTRKNRRHPQPYQATIDLGGIKKIFPSNSCPMSKLNDYVVVHVGYAIGLIEPGKPNARFNYLPNWDK